MRTNRDSRLIQSLATTLQKVMRDTATMSNGCIMHLHMLRRQKQQVWEWKNSSFRCFSPPSPPFCVPSWPSPFFSCSLKSSSLLSNSYDAPPPASPSPHALSWPLVFSQFPVPLLVSPLSLRLVSACPSRASSCAPLVSMATAVRAAGCAGCKIRWRRSIMSIELL